MKHKKIKDTLYKGKKFFSKHKKVTLFLLSVFVLALVLRFLFFPSNTQFAYDHARDAFIAQQVLEGEFKIIGPPTTANPNLNHGALFYYIAGPIYWLFGGNPEGLSLFLRLYNAIGVFIIFAIGTAVANKPIGLLSAFLYAISFEQTQYSLFMGHPTMAVLTTLLFYLGFALLIFQKNSWGLVLAAIGFGLSLQFHFGLLTFAPLFIIYPLIFRKHLPKIPLRIFLFSIVGLALTTITFILAELKYNFRMLNGLISLFSEKTGDTTSLLVKGENIYVVINRYFTDNLFVFSFLGMGLIILGVLFFIVLKQKSSRSAGIFLLIWFLWGLVPYYLANSQTYYYSVGTSISILILAAFLINAALRKNMYVGLAILVLIVVSNLQLISVHNPLGPRSEITSQDGMLLKDEKAIIDYTYKKANGQPFAVNALTIPYTINTTWSYLYDWYGKKTYGYVPVWGGSHADGYHTALAVNTARSTLPDARFLILEQSTGLPGYLMEAFLREENTYTVIISTSSAGLLTVYEQKPRNNE